MGQSLPFYGMIKIRGRLRDQRFEEVFVVSQISEDGILGMPFLTARDCTLLFNRPSLMMQDKELPCTDRYGRALVCGVQVLKDVHLGPGAETVVLCKMNASKYPVMGMIESRLPELPVAASLNRPCDKGHILVRCLNATFEPILVRAGTTVADYSEVCDGDIHTETGLSPSEQVKNSTGVPRKVPAHLQQLFDAAVSGCCNDNQESRLAGLLTKFSDVFSVDNDDVGNTKLVEHSIPVLDGTRPIRQPPHRLGPHKEEEAERQVNKLLEKGLIEPASGAWSSPVVLVKKKDDSWRFCIDYRRVNTVTIQDAYPLPRIDDSLDALAGSRFFSTLDLTSGYWQVPLDEDARKKSAFITRSGLWKWKVLPFGLTSAARYVSAANGTSPTGTPLEDVITLSRRCDRDSARF